MDVSHLGPLTSDDTHYAGRVTAAYEAWLSDMKRCISIAKLEKDPSHQIDGSKGKQKCFGTYKKQSHD